MKINRMAMLNSFESTLETLERLQPQIASWSLENFGDQSYRNPLEGIGEEIGEFTAAVCFDNDNEMVDALADIMIFMMDFASRYRINLAHVLRDCSLKSNIFRPHYIDVLVSSDDKISNINAGLYGLVIGNGELVQGIIKRDQGIRMDRWENVENGLAVILFGAMFLSLEIANVPLWEIVEDVWTGIVSLRSAEPVKVRK